jgi:drug/metabolite transporter (DMT)-like permease
VKVGSRALGGIAAMVASQVAFILNDTCIKLASDELPMGQIIFMRGLMSAALLGAAVVGTGLHRKLALLRRPAVFWRMVGELGGTYFYILALFHIPIANTTIIFQAVPLTATAGAVIFLRERVGWRRWLAILIGFGGVVLVVRPGLSGFDFYALLVLVSVVFVAFRDIWTRAMPPDVPTLLLTGVTSLVVALMGAAMGVSEHWTWPSGLAWLQLAGAAVLIGAGYFFVIAAMRMGDMSVTAPFRYVSVVFAIALGYAIWGETPDTLTIAGSAIIIGAGVYTLSRERRMRGPTPATNAALAVDRQS